MIYSTPAGGDDEVGGQGRGREGRGPGVLVHDDGGHEEADRQQANWSSSQVERILIKCYQTCLELLCTSDLF